MREAELSIVIVNYETAHLVKDCICSICDALQSVSYEIIVVDNNSRENVKEVLDPVQGCIRLIFNKQNFGFGKANNIGAKYCHGKYILFLNSDTIVYKDVFKELLVFLDEHKEVGALGIYLTDRDKNRLHSYGSFPDYIKPAISQRQKSDLSLYKEVDVVIGADLIMPLQLFESIGGFDENIFLYEEEMEMQLRLRKAGYKSVIYKTEGIYHLEGKSSSSYFKLECIFNSSCYIAKKYLGKSNYIIYRIKRVMFALAALVRDLITLKNRAVICEKQRFLFHVLFYKERH